MLDSVEISSENITSLSLHSFVIYRLHKNRMNVSEAYEYFVLRAQKIALSHGYDIINWYEHSNKYSKSKNSQKKLDNM